MSLQGTLYDWRNGNDEVDFVYRIGKKVYAIEVKSGRKKSLNGLAKFREEFQASCGTVITPDNYLDFATNPADFLRRFSLYSLIFRTESLAGIHIFRRSKKMR